MINTYLAESKCKYATYLYLVSFVSVVYAYVMNCCLACGPAQHPASAASVTGYPSKQHSCSAVRVAVLTKELQAFCSWRPYAQAFIKAVCVL